MKPWVLGTLFILTVGVVLYVQRARERIDTLWFGDADAIGSSVLVDGRHVAVLAPAIAQYGAFRADPRVEPCYERGDTAARFGEPMVEQHISMPRDEHVVTVVSTRGDTLECVAQLWDSPRFGVYMRCRTLVYPGITACDIVRADTKQALAK